MAGYGMKLWFIAQDIGQWERTYGEDNAIWGNTPCKLFHAPANDATAERISGLLDDTTVEYEVVQPGRQGGVALHRVRRALLTPDEVTYLAPDTGICTMSGTGLRPFTFRKYGYDPHYKEGTTQ
jgi:type IV secretion system protein VirD4